MGTPQRGSSFDYQKLYKEITWIQSRASEDFSFNELQAILNGERKRIGDIIFAEGGILAGLVPTVGVYDGGSNTTPVMFTDGLVWMRGRMEPVSGVTIALPGHIGAGSKVWLQHLLSEITSVDDNTLVDPNTLDAVDERVAAVCSLQVANPDGLDEDFTNWVLSSDSVTPIYVNQDTVGILPVNRTLGAWAMTLGDPSHLQIGSAYHGLNGLRFNHTNGVTDTLQLTGVVLQPSTGYHVYVAIRTVFGQLDLVSPDGISLSIGRTASATPLVTTFSSFGGTTLIGDFTINHFTFTSDGSASPMDVALSIVSTAPTTMVDVAWILITSTPLGAQDLTRHNFLLFQGNPLVPVVDPAIILPVLASEVRYVPYKDIDGVISPHTFPNVQDALNELTDRRALLAGNAAQVFNVAPALTDTEAPEAGQVQSGALTYAVDTGGPTNYQANYSPAIVDPLTDGMTLTFKAENSNSGAATFQPNSADARPILHADGTALITGDIKAGQVVFVTWQATMNGGVGAWQILQPVRTGTSGISSGTLGADTPLSASSFTALVSVASTPPNTGKNWLAFIQYSLYLHNGGAADSHVLANVTDGTDTELGDQSQCGASESSGCSMGGFMPGQYISGTTVTFVLQAQKSAGGAQATAVSSVDGASPSKLTVRWIPA